METGQLVLTDIIQVADLIVAIFDAGAEDYIDFGDYLISGGIGEGRVRLASSNGVDDTLPEVDERLEDIEFGILCEFEHLGEEGFDFRIIGGNELLR